MFDKLSCVLEIKDESLEEIGFSMERSKAVFEVIADCLKDSVVHIFVVDHLVV